MASIILEHDRVVELLKETTKAEEGIFHLVLDRLRGKMNLFYWKPCYGLFVLTMKLSVCGVLS